MTPRQRWIIIGGLLLATLAAAVLVDEPQPPPAEAATHSTKNRRERSDEMDSNKVGSAKVTVAEASETAEAAATTTLPSLTEPATAAPIAPFRSKTWAVAPPPAPPAKPVAPPLPFQYLGKLSDGDEVRVFLSAQGKYLIAKVGDVINGVYSVESIAGGRITFVYQPLKEKQLLSIGNEK